MPTYRVKLAKGAFDKGQEHDTGVSIFETQERYDQRVDDDGYVTLRKREFDRLRQLGGFIEDSEVDPAAENPNPDLNDDNQRTRTLIPRLPQKSTAVTPGGVGHQAGDAFGNDAVQREFQRDQDKGAAKGRPPEQESVLEASRRSDGHLPEQVKAYEKSVKEHEQSVEKAQKDAAKDREKDRREHERQESKDQDKAQREREQRARDLDTGEQTSDPQGADQAERQNDDARGGDRGESKAKEKSRAGGANKQGS
jgi:hypothetical protein